MVRLFDIVIKTYLYETLFTFSLADSTHLLLLCTGKGYRSCKNAANTLNKKKVDQRQIGDKDDADFLVKVCRCTNDGYAGR